MTAKRNTRGTLAIALSLGLAGCVNDDRGTDDSFDFDSMLVNYADNIIVPSYQRVSVSADIFASPTGVLSDYCAAIGTAEEATELSSVLSGWQELQSTIQQSEAHILGPVTDNDNALRRRLNAYQVSGLSTCGIDQAVVQASQSTDFDVATRTLNQRGIGAVEYLLFNDDLTHTCPSQISETADWDARSETERRQLRCEYAVLMSEDIAEAADTILDAWSVEDGNFRGQFINPSNLATSLESLSDAMFYIELDVKDAKLGLPVGLSDDCLDFACPGTIESPYAENSLQNIRDNLIGFEAMMTGGEGLGFDDLIASQGADDLNSRFAGNTQLALANIDGQSESLLSQSLRINDADSEAICTNATANPETASSIPACNLHGFIKRITDDLKIGFVAAVNVDLPDRSQSDND